MLWYGCGGEQPLIRQLGGFRYGRVTLSERYARIKAIDPAALLLLRDEDCYVAFGLDADCVAHTLLLSEALIDGRPMAAFSRHELARSLLALRKAGFRVVVLSDPLDILVKLSRSVAAGGV